jgi:hypothetical protein
MTELALAIIVLALWVLVSTAYLARQTDKLRADLKNLQAKVAQMDTHTHIHHS